MTLNRFFLLFLSSSIVIYFGFSPFVIDQKKLSNTPQLIFDTFISYEIEGEELNVMLVGEHAERYAGHFKIKDFSLYREVNKSVASISAMNGLYRGQNIVFDTNVEYHGADNMILQTEKAKLNLKQNTLDIRVPFVLSQEDSIFSGSSLFFNQNNAKIKAKDIQASFNF